MNDSFYIGYRKQMPKALSAHLRPRVALLAGAAVVMAVVLAVAQRPFAGASFEFGVVRAFEGVVREHPYPMLVLAAAVDNGRRELLSSYHLVAPGKHGAQELVAGLDDRFVRLRGSLIHRDNQTMIEVRPDSIEPSAAPPVGRGHTEDLGTFALRGEIVDSKCYLGVMKPGHLKPHKACAIRCISGGITPVLCVRDEAGTACYFMLTGSDDRQLNRDVIAFVAEPVEITGRVIRREGFLILKTEPDEIRRL